MSIGNGGLNGAAQNATLAVVARLSAVLMAPLMIGFISWSALTIVSDNSQIAVLTVRLDVIDHRIDKAELRLDLMVDRMIRLEQPRVGK